MKQLQKSDEGQFLEEMTNIPRFVIAYFLEKFLLWLKIIHL
jgi:hypothetical protein